MRERVLAQKSMLFLLILAIAVLAVIVPYRGVFRVHSAFAPYTYQSTLVLDAGHGGYHMRTSDEYIIEDSILLKLPMQLNHVQ